MGVLTDITAKANNNIAKRSSSSTSISIASNTQALNFTNPDENLTKAKSPRYMSPTLSSTQQTATKLSKLHDRDSTPPSSSNKAQGSNWMSSAAKRVGFRRGGDGTPRTGKAGISSKTISFPDKVHKSISLTTGTVLTYSIACNFFICHYSKLPSIESRPIVDHTAFREASSKPSCCSNRQNKSDERSSLSDRCKREALAPFATWNASHAGGVACLISAKASHI